MGGVQYQAAFVNQHASFHLIGANSRSFERVPAAHVKVFIDNLQSCLDPK